MESLNSFRKYLKIYLWFEADIYDRLQLIQILDWFRRYASNGVGIYVLNIERPLNLLTRDEIMDYIIFIERG